MKSNSKIEQEDSKPLQEQSINNPAVFYFTGQSKITEVRMSIGLIKAFHRPVGRTEGPAGFHLKNSVVTKLEFEKSIRLEEALNNLVDTAEFWGLLIGRPQNYSDQIYIVTDKGDEFQVYLSSADARSREYEERTPNPNDVLVSPIESPDEFARITLNWLSNRNAWRTVRRRYFDYFSEQRKYDINRLIGMANLFDLLPEEAIPKSIMLETCMLDALSRSKEMFRDLPNSAFRTSALTALGRLGKPALKDKVLYRAKMVMEKIPNSLPDFELVLRDAIDCRNYYVHGSPGSIEFGRHSWLLSFFTDALSFVYITAELTELGWDIKKWSRHYGTFTHPMTRFFRNYHYRVKHFLKLRSEQTKP